MDGTSRCRTKSNTISYWANGLVYQVDHGNGVVDTQFQDLSGMPRPAGLVTTGATDASSCTLPSTSAQPQPQSITSGQTAILAATVQTDTNTSAHPYS